MCGNLLPVVPVDAATPWCAGGAVATAAVADAGVTAFYAGHAAAEDLALLLDSHYPHGGLAIVLLHCLVCLGVTALKIIRKSIRKSFNSCIGCEILNQTLSDFERSDHLLLNHYLYTIINIYACA